MDFLKRFATAAGNLSKGKGPGLTDFGGDPTVTIPLVKAYCTPSRVVLTGILDPLHIAFECPAVDKVEYDRDKLPLFQTCKVRVKRKQQSWAEYVILSAKGADGRPVFQVDRGYKFRDPKNVERAAGRSGVPLPWDFQGKDSNVEWGESGCSLTDEVKKRKGKEDKDLKRFGKYGSLSGIKFTKEREPRKKFGTIGDNGSPGGKNRGSTATKTKKRKKGPAKGSNASKGVSKVRGRERQLRERQRRRG